jgi:predicted secreted Zn-dependent protease
VARPRYQQGSLKAIGKTSWKIRWREDVTNQDGTVRRIYHAETLRQKNKAGLRIGEILGLRWFSP